MIRFSVGKLPVRVQPAFFLVAVFLGLFPGRTVPSLALWVGIVFVSVLVHELAHALTARRYGATVEIELFAMGGVTRWTRSEPVAPGRRVLIAAAGSAVGISIGLATLALFREAARTASPWLGQAILDVIWVNLGWGVLNWMPIRILDGGQILEGLFEIWFPKRHERIADVFFLASAAVLVAAAVWINEPFLAVLIALFGFAGLGRSRRSRAAARDQQLLPSLEGAGVLLEAGEHEAAAKQARALLPRLATAANRVLASRIIVRALVAGGRADEALTLIEDPPAGFTLGRSDVGMVYLAAGRLKSAVEELSSALEDGRRTVLPTLATAFGKAGAYTEAAFYFERLDPSLLDAEPLLALADHAERAGAVSEALTLRRVASGLPPQSVQSPTEPPYLREP